LLRGGKIEFVQHEGKLILTVPAALREAGDTVVKLTLKDSAMDLPAIEIPPTIKAVASNVYQNDDSDYGAQQAFDDDRANPLGDGRRNEAGMDRR